MDFWLNFRLRVRDFFIKYRLIFIMAIIVIAIVFTINFAVKSGEVKRIARENSINNVNETVIDTKESLPDAYKEPIEELISNYFNYCNNKEYENAYALLNEEFKNLYFKNINRFKIYIDKVFESKRMYNIQNYSNINDTYVYNVRIMPDILATGTTDDYKYVEDKFVVKKENGELKLSLNGYCGKEDLNIISEDDYMKIKIVNKIITYENETYTIQILNKTKNYIVFADGTEQGEVALKISGDSRTADMTDANIVILPNETTTKTVTFNKYFDDGKESKQLILNAIRILPEYSGNEENRNAEMAKAVKLYSLTINLEPNIDD